MRGQDKLIYIVGTISTIALGLLVVGGIALFLTNRIEAASSTHAQREEARLAELPKESLPAEFIIEDVDINTFSGSVHWGTSDDSSEGEIVFYTNDDGSFTLSEIRSEFPQGLNYSEKTMNAIEKELETSR